LSARHRESLPEQLLAGHVSCAISCHLTPKSVSFSLLKFSKFFFILQRCFTQYLLKSRNEMLLAAVAKVIGNRCPIWLLALAALVGRRQELVALEQPFEPNADVVPKELL